MAWSVLQSNSVQPSGISQTNAVAYTSNVTSGTKLIAYVQINADVAQDISYVQDGAGNQFTRLAGASYTADNIYASMWSLDTPSGDAGTKPTITAGVNSNNGFITILIEEVSGLLPGTSPLDGTAGTNSGSGTTTSASYGSTAANEFLVTFMTNSYSGSAWSSVPSGYALDSNSVDNGTYGSLAVAYKNSTGGTESDNWSLSTSTAWTEVFAAFKLAGGGPSAGPAFRPAVQAIRAKLPQPQAYRAGLVYGSAAKPGTTENSLGTGRISFCWGAPVQNPGAGPVFRQAVHSARAVIPQVFSKGRVSSNPGAPLGNPGTGPVFRAAVKPARAPVPQSFSKGRASGNPGAAARNPSAGPAVYAPEGPARSRTAPPFSKGRANGNAGAPARNPLAGPVFYPAVRPVRAPVPQVFSRGRIASSAGAPLQNPSHGPAFRQATAPARIRPSLPPRGRVASNAGGPVRNPPPAILGPPFYPLRFPARARIPENAPRGRVSSSPGAPLRNPSQGPAFPGWHGPVRQRLPQLGRTGRRDAFSTGAPVVNPVTGPAFRQAVRPVRAPVPQVFSRGRAYGSPGAPVRNPAAGPVVYAPQGPARIRTVPPFSKGRAGSNPGTPARNPGQGPAVTALRGPVQSRVPLPPRGRASGNLGIPVASPAKPAPLYPLHGPVAARRPLPLRGRVITGSQGAPVRNPSAGPPAYLLHGPVLARIPGPFRKGSAQSTTAKIVPVPVHQIEVRLDLPFTRWPLGQPRTRWLFPEPGYARWNTGDP
jgi:hypothetical protein